MKDFEFEKDYTNDAKDDISTLLADYYKAYVGDDLDTLGKLATPMSDNEKSYIGVVSQYYESVNDITPYTKNGLKKKSRTWRCRSSDCCIFYCNNNIS